MRTILILVLVHAHDPQVFLTRAGALGTVAALALTACGSQNTQIGQNTQTSPSASTSASATLVPITEGKLRIFDQATGAELGSVQLMEAWTDSETWQDERPALWVDGKTAYVTDPATKKLIAVSLSSPAAPKELMSVNFRRPRTRFWVSPPRTLHRLRLRHTALLPPRLRLTHTNPARLMRATPTRALTLR